MDNKNLAEVKEEANVTNVSDRVEEFFEAIKVLGDRLGIENCLIICEGQQLGIGTLEGILGVTPEGGSTEEVVNLDEITLRDVLDKIDFNNPGKWHLDELKDNISILIMPFLPVMQIMDAGRPIAFICKRNKTFYAYATNDRGIIDAKQYVAMDLNALLKDFPMDDVFVARHASQVRRTLEYICTTNDWRS